MRFDPRRMGARCNECPIWKHCKGKIKPVGARWVDGAPSALVLAEGPGSTEETLGKPLVGQSGQMLDYIFEKRGDHVEFGASMPSMDRVHKSNAVLCKSPEKLSDVEWRQAIACCRPRLRRELDLLIERGWNGRAITLGSKALQCLSGERFIKDWMGPPKDGAAFARDGKRAASPADIEIDFRDVSFLPTVHPAFCLRQPQWTGVLVTHFLRGWEYCTNHLPEWKWKPTFVETHDAQSIISALESLNLDKPLAMDTETDGPQHPLTLRSQKHKGRDFRQLNLLDVGFSNGKLNVCVQWWYWYPRAVEGDPLARRIIGLTVRLVTQAKKAIWQNCLYDLVALYAIEVWDEARGKVKEWFPDWEHSNEYVARPWFDTLFGFRLMSPLLPASLAFQAAFFTHAERWKDEFKTGSGDDPSDHYAKADPLERATYCARDCQQTYNSYERVVEQIDAMHNGWSLWGQLRVLLDVALDMQIQGASVDVSTFAELEAMLKKGCAKYYQMQVQLVADAGGLQKILGLSDEAWFKTQYYKQTKREIETGAAPRMRKKPLKWNPNSSVHVAKYFASVGHKPLVFTDNDDPSYKAAVLEGLCAHVNPAISGMARAILFYRKDYKLLSTNIRGLPYRTVGGVAMVHPGWGPAQAKSGRWRCKAPNLMNIKKSMRQMFVGDTLPEGEIECDTLCK